MRGNPVGDFVTGTTGGLLVAYFVIGAALVLFTGQGPAFGPTLPIEPLPGASVLGVVMIRIVLTAYHAGLACLAFLGFRVMQELLRGRALREALREAGEMPQLWP